MTATLTIQFDDGTKKEITLSHAIEINTPGRQSLEFRETTKGPWVMSYTKSLFEGKKLAWISMTKTHEQQ